MSIEVKQDKKGSIRLTIQDEMTIYTALQQKKLLFSHLISAKSLQIDLAGVSEIDSAGLQLLLFLKREAVLHNIKLSLIQHSQAVLDVMELLNLSKYFGDPIVISADRKSS
ncbi:STAS domain-containing protein [Methylicorpusculum oleiharenae]|uniref:STAS domain-containing protein n=1 Tax=Methylicorpusculum oleiharenae TaxID=1338687 RepID=UPI001359CA49|nr:STAS domain-containing protein [Methylicorpusculum oleiharenae]MCD2449391.1 STAS domain-containing protein [Methylicorpusculum oleiharenae]